MGKPISPDQWDKFFKLFGEFGVEKSACLASGIDRTSVWKHRQAAEKEDATDEQKAWLARWKEAEQCAGDTIEEAMYRRGVQGVEEPVIGRVGKDQDGVVTTVRRYSDACLIRLALARRRDKFSDKVQQEISGPGGAPIQTETKVIAVPAIEEGAPE